jgi:hypothetical protein
MNEGMQTPLASSSNRMSYLSDDFNQAGQTIAPLEPAKTDTALVEAIAARIPRLRDAIDPLRLTPLRAHYLKKALVKLQVDAEMQNLSSKGEVHL